jgi:16S rRNA (cytidine1402-2'-O)-methyltransferase
LIFLESPHRLLDSLSDMHLALGDRPAAVARELTKLHEEIWRGRLGEVARHYTQPRGEFVVVIGGRPPADRPLWTQAEIRAAVKKRLKTGTPPTTIAAELAAESGWKRRDIYKLASTLG